MIGHEQSPHKLGLNKMRSFLDKSEEGTIEVNMEELQRKKMMIRDVETRISF